MAQIKNKKQYDAARERIEELLKVVSNDTPVDDKNLVELDLLSDLVADYEDIHYPMTVPSLADVLKYRMTELNLTQGGVAKLLGVSQSRVSEYLTGKSEPTLNVARAMRKELHIDADIILA